MNAKAVMPRWVILSLLCTGASVCAQVAQRPSRIVLDAPKTVATSTPGKVSIRLINAAGQPVAAESDTTLHVSAPNAKLDPETVVVPKGQNSAHVNITMEHPGVADLRVEESKTPTTILSATTQIGFSPAEDYAPLLPLRLSLALSPRAQLMAGTETGTLVALLLDARNVPTPANRDIAISFPGLSQNIIPHPMRIPRGSAYAEASLNSSSPDRRTVIPVLSPAAVSGKPIMAETLKFEFVSPIGGVRILPLSSYIQAIWRSAVPVKIGLVDSQGNWMAADKDHTVILEVDPPDVGRFKETSLTIPKGVRFSEASYFPFKEGIAKINASAGPLPVYAATIEFRYRALFYALLALLGGLAGGFLRYYLLDQAKRTLKALVISLAVGAVSGLLGYILAPVLVTLSFKPENLQNASKLLEAFVWGVLGGLAGPAVLAGKLEGLIGKKPA